MASAELSAVWQVAARLRDSGAERCWKDCPVDIASEMEHAQLVQGELGGSRASGVTVSFVWDGEAFSVSVPLMIQTSGDSGEQRAVRRLEEDPASRAATREALARTEARRSRNKIPKQSAVRKLKTTSKDMVHV